MSVQTSVHVPNQSPPPAPSCSCSLPSTLARCVIGVRVCAVLSPSVRAENAPQQPERAVPPLGRAMPPAHSTTHASEAHGPAQHWPTAQSRAAIPAQLLPPLHGCTLHECQTPRSGPRPSQAEWRA